MFQLKARGIALSAARLLTALGALGLLHFARAQCYRCNSNCGPDGCIYSCPSATPGYTYCTTISSGCLVSPHTCS
jgi:hypothetical protein